MVLWEHRRPAGGLRAGPLGEVAVGTVKARGSSGIEDKVRRWRSSSKEDSEEPAEAPLGGEPQSG